MGSFAKSLLSLLGVIVLLSLCLSLLTIQSCGTQISDVSEPPSESDTGPPSDGRCDNVGEVYDDNPFSGWPVQGGVHWGRVTASYCDAAYRQMFGRDHYGIDLGYGVGTPVIATASGHILAAGWHDEMGLFVRLCVEEWCATYMHLATLTVLPGQDVEQGAVVGEVGSSGMSSGPHVHFQINDPDWITVDPAPTMGR